MAREDGAASPTTGCLHTAVTADEMRVPIAKATGVSGDTAYAAGWCLQDVGTEKPAVRPSEGWSLSTGGTEGYF